MRGFKCKENSLKEILQENQPTILMVMETLCEEKEIDLEGYKVKAIKKRDDQWGGIMFAVRNEFAHQSKKPKYRCS